MYHHNLVSTRFDSQENWYESTFRCTRCNRYFKIKYTKEQKKRINGWLLGEGSIQFLLPETLPEWREVWISGMCIKCQNEFFRKGGMRYGR